MTSNLFLNKGTHGKVKRLRWMEKIGSDYSLKSKSPSFEFKFEFKYFELKFKLKKSEFKFKSYLNLN